MGTPEPPCPRELFERLLLALGARRPVPDEVLVWFLSAGYRYRDGQTPTLCKALGLRQHGRPSMSISERREYRNLWLRSAYAGVGCPGALVSDYARTRRLAQTIERFTSRQWPRLRRMDPEAARQGLGWVDRCLLGAFEVGLPVPVSDRALWRIVRPEQD